MMTTCRSGTLSCARRTLQSRGQRVHANVALIFSYRFATDGPGRVCGAVGGCAGSGEAKRVFIRRIGCNCMCEAGKRSVATANRGPRLQRKCRSEQDGCILARAEKQTVGAETDRGAAGAKRQESFNNADGRVWRINGRT